MLQRLCMPSWQILGDQNGSGELTHCPRVTRGEDKEAIHRDIWALAQTPAHIKELTFHQSRIPFSQYIRPRPPASTSQRPRSSSGLTQPQSFLSEAQLRSPAPHKTEPIQSWPLEPPLEAWRTDRAKGPTRYPLPPPSTCPARSKPPP